MSELLTLSPGISRRGLAFGRHRPGDEIEGIPHVVHDNCVRVAVCRIRDSGADFSLEHHSVFARLAGDGGNLFGRQITRIGFGLLLLCLTKRVQHPLDERASALTEKVGQAGRHPQSGFA